MHFSPPTDDQSSANAAVTAAQTFLGAVDNFLRVSQAYSVDPEVLAVDPASGQTTNVFTVTPTAMTGADAGDAVPNAAMILVRWRTGAFFSGRELRGRTFIPGCTETSVDTTGNLGSTPISAINSAAATLISGSDFCIWSPTRGVTAEATTGSTWSEFAVLRSRRD